MTDIPASQPGFVRDGPSCLSGALTLSGVSRHEFISRYATVSIANLDDSLNRINGSMRTLKMHVERSVAPESIGVFDAQRQHEPWYVASKDAGVMLTRCPMAGLASLWKPHIQEYHAPLTHVGQASEPNWPLPCRHGYATVLQPWRLARFRCCCWSGAPPLAAGSGIVSISRIYENVSPPCP